MTPDEENQLNLLSLLHYVMGGLTALFSCFPLIYVAMGLALVTGTLTLDTPSDAKVARLTGFIIIGAGLSVMLLGWVLAFALIMAGKKLKERLSLTYCIVIAGVECLMLPLGTILGVFTLIMLTKESVKNRFVTSTP